MDMIMEYAANFLTTSNAAWAATVYVCLAGVGSAVVAARQIVKSTKTKKDDAWVARVEVKPVAAFVLRLVERFSLVKPKNK